MRNGDADGSSEKKPGRTWFVVAAAALVALHVWGALQPEHANWGVHFFAFYPFTIGFVVLAIALLALLPEVQTYILRGLEHLLHAAARLPLALQFFVALSALVAAATLFGVKIHLLGDGAVLLRSNAFVEWGSDLKLSFANQPLMRLIYRAALLLHPAGKLPAPQDIYVALDLAAGGAFLAILFWFFRSGREETTETILAAVFLFLSASSLFFFGYVENYVLQFVVAVLFCLSGWRALDGTIPVVVPLAAFIVLAGLHLGFLSLCPAVLYLLFVRYRERKMVAIAIVVGLSIAGVILILASGFDVALFLRHLSSGSVDFLQPFSANGGNFPYPMFSLRHLGDWLNALLLVSPFALVLAAGLVPRGGVPDPVRTFLITASLCGLIFTWIVNFALGMARDWDLFSTFCTPLIVLALFLLLRTEPAAYRRSILLVAVVLTALHWGAWIGVNASTDRQLARMRLLRDPLFLSPVSQMVYDEAMANFHFDRGEYADARGYYVHLMSIDSNNPRIVGNMADTYRRLGDRDHYFTTLLHAVEINSRDPGIYSNIGVEYALRGDTASAIAYNERALLCDSSYRLAHANLGVLYGTRNDLPRSERHLARAIDGGLREPSILRYAGDVSAILGHYSRALEYYNSYLALVPDDPAVIESRRRAELLLHAKSAEVPNQ